MTLNVLHNGLSNACTIFSLVIFGYGLWTFFRDRGVSGPYLGVLAIGEMLYLTQLAVGVLLALQGGVAARAWIHYLYGIVLVISLPGLYAFLRGRDSRQEALVYAFMGLFLAGISLRSITTGTQPLPF
jgi:hypothetical protein